MDKETLLNKERSSNSKDREVALITEYSGDKRAIEKLKKKNTDLFCQKTKFSWIFYQFKKIPIKKKKWNE